MARVPTLSASSCKLHFLQRADDGQWSSEIVADRDDGYYGADGRRYTGALCHLVFDSHDVPHVAFVGFRPQQPIR